MKSSKDNKIYYAKSNTIGTMYFSNTAYTRQELEDILKESKNIDKLIKENFDAYEIMFDSAVSTNTYTEEI